MAALAILPLAIIAQLNESITLGQMFGFLAVSVIMFFIGYLLQSYMTDGKS